MKETNVWNFVLTIHLYRLDPLVPLLSQDLIDLLMGALKKRLKQDNQGDSTSITFMAIRTVVGKSFASPSVARILTGHLFDLLDTNQDSSIDFLDVLIDHIKRFGSSIADNEVLSLEAYLRNVLSNGRGIVRKRGAIAIGYLLRYLSDAKWQDLLQFIISGLDDPKSNPATIKILVFLTGILAKNDPGRFKNHINELFSRVHSALKEDSLDDEDSQDDEDLAEIRETGLVAMEAIAGLGSPAIDSLVDTFLVTVKNFIKYDPNYNEPDSDDEAADDVEMSNANENNDDDDDNDDEDSLDMSDQEEDDQFSDDEDQSWKLRRYAFKLCAAVVLSSPYNLPKIYSELLSAIIKRASAEREDTVKLEAIHALSVMITAASDDGPYYTSKAIRARRSSDASMKTEGGDPQSLLQSESSRIVKITKSAISSPSTNIQVIQGFITDTLHKVIVVLKGLDSELAVVVNMLSFLSKNKQSILVDILQTVSAILKYHSVHDLQPYLSALVPVIILGIEDSYYKISTQGLEVAMDLFSVGVETELPMLDKVEVSINSKATSNSYDLETRETAIKALSELIGLGMLSDGGFSSGVTVITELLNNESLRLAAVNAIETISKHRPVAFLIPSWTVSVLESLSGFLKQNSRPLRMSSLSAIRAITISVVKGEKDIPSEVSTALQNVRLECLKHGNELLQSLVDTQVMSIIFTILTNLTLLGLSDNSNDTADFVVSVLRRDVAMNQVDNSLMELVDTLGKTLPPQSSMDMVSQLESGAVKKDNEVHAQIVSCLILHQPDLSKEIQKYINNLETGQIDIKWSAMIIGNLGKRPETSAQFNINIETLYKHFESTDEGVKTACAQALGDFASTHIDTLLDEILKGLDSESKISYLYLTAVRELILTGNIKSSNDAMQKIWNQLFSLKNIDEGERSKVAECVGRLSILNPEKFLPELQSYLSSPNWAIRVTALSSVKYTFGQSHDRYDELLRPIILNFLELVEDEKLEIRQVALSTLISAIHNKPNLVVPHLPNLLPILHKETMIDESRIRHVQMGPFKQKFDDGLYLRKTAYETIYTLVTTLSPNRLKSIVNLGYLLERVIAGLNDEHDIKVLSCVTIGRIAGIDMDVLISAPDGGISNIIGKFNGLLGVQVKENAIKQEFEKQGEVVRSVQRASHQIDEVIQAKVKEGESSGLSDVELSEWNKYMAGIAKN